MNNNIINAVISIKKINIEPSSTIQSIKDRFYDICRENGIKQGTPSINDKGEVVGVCVSRHEWTICKDTLKSVIESYFVFMDLLDEVPEDLKM